MEENKVLKTKKLKDNLLEISDLESVNIFLEYLYTNFGEGEILPDEHVINIFEKRFNENNLLVQYYIDTFRVLGLMSEDENILLTTNESHDLLYLHNEVTIRFKEEASEELKKKFITSMIPFWKYVKDNNNYKVDLIGTAEELSWEGKYMNHCIATYLHIVAKGDYIGFKFFNKNSWERLTLGCLNRGGKLVFNQLKAHSNYPASPESKKFAIEYCEEIGIECDSQSYDLI